MAALGHARTRPVSAGDRWRSLRALILNPMQLVPFALAPLYVVGQHLGFIARVPIWLIVGALLATQLTTSMATLVVPPGSPAWQTSVRAGFMIVMTGLTVYLTGWGAVFAIGFVFNVAEQMRIDGARVVRLSLPWIAVTIAAGELAVALGWVPSLLPQPAGHGLAVLCGLGACVLSVMLGWTTAAKERFEQSLRHSEQRLRALVQHSSDVIIVIGPDFKIDYASPSSVAVLGLERDALSGDGIHPDDRPRASEFFRWIGEDPGRIGRLDVRLRHADGHYRWFEVGVCNRLDDPSVGGLVCNMRDVTERHHAVVR